MKGLLLFLAMATVSVFAQAEEKVMTNKEKSIVKLAAFAATGNQTELKSALGAGLDAGLTVNECKEVCIQSYAYCGFPRSLNALGTLMAVVKERGNSDKIGTPASALPNGKSIDFGTENQTKLVGAPVKSPLFDFAPAIDTFLKAHLFGDIFARDVLDWKTREIATVAMLAARSGVESQLNSHIKVAKHNGVTDEQISEILSIVKNDVLGGVNTSPFPFGEANIAYSKYFSGKSWLARLTQSKELGIPVANVTFEPGCRNNWHSHTGGQILIAVGGVGFYQERGKAARRLVPGDVVEILPNVEHWHGASPTDWFAHLAIEAHPETNKNTWLEPVNDEEYAKATNSESLNQTALIPEMKMK